jgi:predicted DCC family thiol-disulfide oxidoreductase YuxK
VLLYDDECGFCRWALAWVLRLDQAARIRPLPLLSPEADALLRGVPEHERLESWHLVAPDGRVSSAGDAFAPLLEQLPRGRRAARMARALGPALRWAYRLVASNRSALGALIPARSKARASVSIERHRKRVPH